MDKSLNDMMKKPSHEYGVKGVGGSIGHATSVHPISANVGQEDISRIDFKKMNSKGYVDKAHQYKY